MIGPATPPRPVIAGLGLIGGAVAAAWRRAGVVGETLGFDPDPAACRVAAERGLVDRIAAAIGAELEGLRACPGSLQQALANPDAAALESLFARAGAARRALELQ